MRAWLVVALLMLGGCTTDPGAVDDGVQEAAQGDGTGGALAADNSTSPPATQEASGNATGTQGPGATANGTSPDGNGTAGSGTPEQQEPPPLQVLVNETFSGSLPLDGATTGTHTVTIPEGAERLSFTYVSTHAGLFSAVAHAHDPAGTARLDSLDACAPGLNPGAAAQDTCTMELEQSVDAGDWAFEVHWQLGQAVEDYDLRVVVMGRA